MQITYDPRADALYIQLESDDKMKSVNTKQIENVIVDLNADGKIIGIEVLDIRRSGFDPNVQVMFPGQAELPHP